ncbi:NUDIX domain-containing protein [Amycolatopsis sp. NBC_01307]|uniref:NUDIX hydrolase n=1 Tax=Amycolatopsis sp. NBC_01307 TaxID=2903561 RepID=UPI002E124C31|nr:NUDIX domain-containing protein [Amycolatopsis sp. NBC_01307]
MGIVVVAVAGVFGSGWAWLAFGVVVAGGVGMLGWVVLRDREPASVSGMGSTIRPLALGVIRRGGALLVFEGHDGVKDETFYRPLGGGIEFGETGAEALRREFREELDADVEVGARIEVLENVFVSEGRTGHEIVFLYDAAFADRGFYAREEFKILDDDSTARWVDVADFRDGSKILYPTGLTELLSPEQ